MPDVKLVEVDQGLLALADFELGPVAESRGQKRQGNGCRALRTGVDQSIDGLRVVRKIGREDGIGELIAVVGNEEAIVGRNLLSFPVAEAVLVVAMTLVKLCRRLRKGTDSQERGGKEACERRHCLD